MKRDFLKDLGLEKDVIDQIMAANGEDIENARKAEQKTWEAEKEQLSTQISQFETQAKKRDADLKKLQDKLTAKENDDVKLADAQKALDVCQKIIAEDKTAAYSGEVAPAYWQALLKLGKNDQLEGLLKKATSSADRPASAAALVMRGDIIRSTANGDHAKLRLALRDGYLRVAMMYRDPPCRNERREALLKAAEVFNEIGQASRAETLRREAKSM